MNVNLLTGFAIFLMFSALVVGVAYYYSTQFQQCTNNPLTFGAKVMQERFGYEFVGTGYFITPINIRTPLVVFDSNNVSFQFIR